MRSIHKKHTPITTQSGFTIVELMIATVVFSMILVVITAGVISFSNQYYKSVNAADTQNTARDAIDAVSQAIQFSGATVVGTDTSGGNFFCAGGYIFSFARAVLYDGSAATVANPGLYMQPAGTGCSSMSTFTGGKQLLGKNQRVTQVSVTQNGDLFTVVVGIAYGGNDVLCTTNTSITAGRCGGSGVITNADIWNTASELSCRTGAGSPYCATSILRTVVEKRLGA